MPMEMTGEFRIPAPRQRVWEGLNDPEILKSSIPGCQTIEKVSDTEFTAQGRRPGRTGEGQFRRQGDVVGSRPAAELHDRRRGQRRRRRLRQGQRQGQPRRRRRRDRAELCRPGACRRQARADRLAPDRLASRARWPNNFFTRFVAAVAPEQPPAPAASGSRSRAAADRSPRPTATPARGGATPIPRQPAAARSETGGCQASAGCVGHRARRDRRRDALFLHPPTAQRDSKLRRERLEPEAEPA